MGKAISKMCGCADVNMAVAAPAPARPAVQTPRQAYVRGLVHCQQDIIKARQVHEATVASNGVGLLSDQRIGALDKQDNLITQIVKQQEQEDAASAAASPSAAVTSASAAVFRSILPGAVASSAVAPAPGAASPSSLQENLEALGCHQRMISDYSHENPPDTREGRIRQQQLQKKSAHAKRVLKAGLEVIAEVAAVVALPPAVAPASVASLEAAPSSARPESGPSHGRKSTTDLEAILHRAEHSALNVSRVVREKLSQVRKES